MTLIHQKYKQYKHMLKHQRFKHHVVFRPTPSGDSFYKMYLWCRSKYGTELDIWDFDHIDHDFHASETWQFANEEHAVEFALKFK